MDTSNIPDSDQHAPNHHAHHPGFSGVSGLVAALSMAFGRDETTEIAIDLAGLTRSDRLVDVGCGPGAAVRRAARSGATVVAVDPAPVMVRTARLLALGRTVSFAVGRAEALPVDDGWATVAWTMASVHHWPDVDGGIAELHRALASGGRLVAIERRIDAAATGLASHGWTPEQADSFAERCRRVGFVEVEVVERLGHRGPVLAVVGRRAS